MRFENKTISRREFLKLAGLSFAGYVVYETFGFLFSVERAKSIEIVHHVIKLSNVDKKWDRTFLVHFSDMHISARATDFVNPEVVQKVSSEVSNFLRMRCAQQKKTFFIDTGDIVSSVTGTGEPTNLADVDESLTYLSQIPALAFFSVHGNHEAAHPDYIGIHKQLETHGFLSLGLLDQEKYCFDHAALPFTLASLPDFTSREKTWFKSRKAESFLHELKERESQKPMVLASHTSLADSWKGGLLQNTVKNTLFLHGHTHGGQIGANTPLQYIVGRHAVFDLVKQKSRFYRGITDIGNGNLVSVSSGIGHSGLHHVRTAKPGVVIYEFVVA